MVDSGAVHSVWKKGMYPSPIRPSAMSRSGKMYKSASRHPIPNEGEQIVKFETEEGHQCGIKMQIANVDRPLLSTADLTAAGNTVELSQTSGRITNRNTGKTMKLIRRGNIFHLWMWVEDSEKPVFVRQGS